jgi:hypothetical protein
VTAIFPAQIGSLASRSPESAFIRNGARYWRGRKFPADCFFCQCLGMTQPAPAWIDCLKAIDRAHFAHKSGPHPVPRWEISMRGTGKSSLTLGLALIDGFLILAPAAAMAQSINIPLPFIGGPHFGGGGGGYHYRDRTPAPSHHSSSSSHESSSSSSNHESSSGPEKDATQEGASSNDSSHQSGSPSTTRSQTSEATPPSSSSSSAPASSSANRTANDAPAFAPSR